MDSLKNISKGGWHPGKSKEPSYSSSSSSGGGSSFKGVDQVVRRDFSYLFCILCILCIPPIYLLLHLY